MQYDTVIGIYWCNFNILWFLDDNFASGSLWCECNLHDVIRGEAALHSFHCCCLYTQNTFFILSPYNSLLLTWYCSASFNKAFKSFDRIKDSHRIVPQGLQGIARIESNLHVYVHIFFRKDTSLFFSFRKLRQHFCNTHISTNLYILCILSTKSKRGVANIPLHNVVRQNMGSHSK